MSIVCDFGMFEHAFKMRNGGQNMRATAASAKNRMNSVENQEQSANGQLLGCMSAFAVAQKSEKTAIGEFGYSLVS